MQKVLKHIERVKTRPHHVRKQLTYAYATAGTGLIAVLWLGTSLATGAFHIKDRENASEPTLIAEAPSRSLAGADAASLAESEAAPAHIRIVDVATTSERRQTEQTIIPF